MAGMAGMAGMVRRWLYPLASVLALIISLAARRHGAGGSYLSASRAGCGGAVVDRERFLPHWTRDSDRN